MSWQAELRTAHLILELRELLVRHDENEKAYKLLAEVVPFYCLHRTDLRHAALEQHEMVKHLLSDDAYKRYYQANPHEQSFEEQCRDSGITVENAHEHVYRLKFLRQRLIEYAAGRILDLACNDGWMAANLHAIDWRTDGIDLGVACIQRAIGRKIPGSAFRCGHIEHAAMYFPVGSYDAVVAFEVVEHVRDPDKLLRVMCQMCAGGGSIYVSTPEGVDHDGDLPTWNHVEAKGHVRVYTAEAFKMLLEGYGQIQEMHVGPDRVMVAEVKPHWPPDSPD